jgi:hypothetical protein
MVSLFYIYKVVGRNLFREPQRDQGLRVTAKLPCNQIAVYLSLFSFVRAQSGLLDLHQEFHIALGALHLFK